MAELNKVLMIGRLTRDPELRYTPSGLPVAEMRLAVNHTYRTKEEKREEVCYIDVNLMGRGGEVAKQYLSKGREIFVEGRLRLEEWESKEGEKRSTYRVVADRFQFLGGRGEGEGGGRGRYDEASASGGGASGGASGGDSGGASAGASGGPSGGRRDDAVEQDEELPF